MALSPQVVLNTLLFKGFRAERLSSRISRDWRGDGRRHRIPADWMNSSRTCSYRPRSSGTSGPCWQGRGTGEGWSSGSTPNCLSQVTVSTNNVDFLVLADDPDGICEVVSRSRRHPLDAHHPLGSRPSRAAHRSACNFAASEALHVTGQLVSVCSSARDECLACTTSFAPRIRPLSQEDSEPRR